MTAEIDHLAGRLFALGAAPGMGVVVVRDTQIIYSRGFGFANMELRRPFTAETEFYIGSTTKAFTGLAVAMLDLTGAMKLDTPITRYLPGIPLRAAIKAESVTIRQLLTHTHGIGDGPVDIRLAYTGEYESNAELIALLADHAPSPSGRAYSYGNIGYNVVALAMDTVLGESWKTTLDRLILAPLGMTKTSAYVSTRSPERLAAGYVATANGLAPALYAKTDGTMQSAGGLITTLEDLGVWLEAQINDGRVDGRQVLPARAILETRRVQVGTPGYTRGGPLLGYGLGWRIGLRGADTVVFHGGGFPGFGTHVSFMPGRRLGVAVLANEARLGGAMAEILAHAIYDILTAASRDQDETVRTLSRVIQREHEVLAADQRPLPSGRCRLPYPLQAYTGRFHDHAMGHLEIVLRDGALEARLGNARSSLRVFDGPRNRFQLVPFGDRVVATVLMNHGRAEGVEMAGTVFPVVTEP